MGFCGSRGYEVLVVLLDKKNRATLRGSPLSVEDALVFVDVRCVSHHACGER